MMEKDNFNSSLDPGDLRRRAEERLKKSRLLPDSKTSAAELQRMLHELPVHQIELEMQYEQLQYAYNEIQQEHKRYSDLYDYAPVGYMTLARDGTILDSNHSADKMLSCDRSHLIGARLGSFIAQADLPAFNHMVHKVFQSRTLEHCEVMIESSGGTNKPAPISLTCRLDAIISDNPEECRLTLIDISETRRALEALKNQEAQYRCLFDASQEGILILDYQSGKIVDANPHITQLMGFSLEEVVGKELWENGFIMDKELARKAYLELQTKNYIRYSDLPLQHKSGKIIDVEFLSYVYDVGDKKAIQCNIRDITLQKQIQENEKRQNMIIEQFAKHDSLTGLPNRRFLSERVSLTIAQCRRNKTMAALMIFDLDNFKIVNDTLGHAIGDILLQEVAVRSMSSLQRSGDSIARLGGDEFVVLLPQIEALSNAVAIAEIIRQKLREPYIIEGHPINISCSIGIAVFPDHGKNELTIMKHADDAMYLAKNKGRDKVFVYEPQAQGH